MKIAVAGKGGSGKTTVAGTLARAFAADGYDVLAIDDDDDPNLSITLGVSRDAAGPPLPDDLVTRVESAEADSSYELTTPPQAILDDYGIVTPDRVTLLKAGEVEAGSGCFGTSHATVRQILSKIAASSDAVTIIDLPNGIEHLGLATAKDVDVMLVVVEPSYNSMETARRIQPLAVELDIPALRVVANKVRTERDKNAVEDYCFDHDLRCAGVIPFDDTIRKAERSGTAPFDADPHSPAMYAIRELAADLVEGQEQRRTGPNPPG